MRARHQSRRSDTHKKKVEQKGKGGRIKRPLDDVERALCAVFRGEIVEWGVEHDADVVHLLSEDRGNVAEGGRRGAGERPVFLLGDVIGNDVDERNCGHFVFSKCVSAVQRASAKGRNAFLLEGHVRLTWGVPLKVANTGEMALYIKKVNEKKETEGSSDSD